MRGKTWRHRLFDHGDAPPAGGMGASAGAPSAPAGERAGGQRVWAFLCPNPLCDTELVIFPEYAGSLVECPSCGFAFVAPRVVPLQIVTEAEPGTESAGRPFAPGARMVRRGAADGGPRGRGIPAPLPPPCERHSGGATRRGRPPDAALSNTTPAGLGPSGSVSPKAAGAADALDALAHGVSLPASAKEPACAPAPPASGESSGADGLPRPKPADTEALRALARAAADEVVHPLSKRGAPARPKGIGAMLASATLEGERRRAARIRTAADAAGRAGPVAKVSERRAAGAAPPWQSAVPDMPLSEGERASARQRRTDLVVTWVVAAVVSAAFALAAYLTGVPDVGLGALLLVGLAGLRTYWLGRAARKDALRRP